MKRIRGASVLVGVAAILALTGCNTFKMSASSVAAGTTVDLKSVTPCPPTPLSLFEFIQLYTAPMPEPGTISSSFTWADNAKRSAWTAKLFTYSSVQDYPMNPQPFITLGTYNINPSCATAGEPRLRYDNQTLRVGGPHGVSAPSVAHRGSTIRISGTYCHPGDFALAGILLAHQPDRFFNDPDLIKAFGTGTVDSRGAWTVALTDLSGLPAGSYIVRAECRRGDVAAREDEVAVGFAPRIMTVD